MPTETGRIVAIDADSLWVETIRKSTCGTCSAQKGCGHGLLNRIRDGQRGLVRVLPGTFPLADCRVNDEVSISLPDEVILRGSLIVYMLPLVTMLAGASAGGHWLPWSADLAAVAGAVAGFAGGVALVRWHAWHHRDDARLQPVLAAVARGQARELQTLQPL
ncbi:SoxR reducing system RseC family protein [Haliea sp. E1-2-M8]|uniref:SoxR reducing system RseC family protein n=1 Tax=Haliea sp. E1-2-M8 TaxID=3064706 RepID=UPI002725E383|nr:SoxR reducing system RseC family protein [Haliea sp. E1-2-M8]MDO8860764.1 SoxR reducing system RseC family protein [Haliea sp. E1-2-M8]